VKFRNPFVRERKSRVIDIPQGTFLEYALGEYSNMSARQALKFYKKNSSVATAVDLVADAIAGLRPVVEHADKTVDFESPVLDLLKAPNAFETPTEFMTKISSHYLITGDSHVALLGNVNRPPLEVHGIKPQFVQPLEGMDGFPERYNIDQGVARGAYIRKERKKAARFVTDNNLAELLHMTRFSSRDTELSGDSPLEAAAMEIKQQILGRRHNYSLLNNGGRLSLIVTFEDEELKDDEHRRRKRRINEDLSGAENAGKIAVMTSEGKVQVREVGKSNRDMDYAELDKTAALAIYLRYKIPLPLITLDASTFNNLSSAIEFLYDNAVLPRANAIYESLTKILFPRFDLDPKRSRLTYDLESVTALIERTVKVLKIRRELNLETANELRSFIPNRKSIPGGDVLYQPAKLVPLGSQPKLGVEG
jgi:HK97 family phage portal protein